MKERKLRDLVSGNGSLRIVVRALNSKSQQQLADRMHFIENLGKSDIEAAFKQENALAAQVALELQAKMQGMLRNPVSAALYIRPNLEGGEVPNRDPGDAPSYGKSMPNSSSEWVFLTGRDHSRATLRGRALAQSVVAP